MQGLRGVEEGNGRKTGTGKNYKEFDLILELRTTLPVPNPKCQVTSLHKSGVGLLS